MLQARLVHALSKCKPVDNLPLGLGKIITLQGVVNTAIIMPCYMRSVEVSKVRFDLLKC